ncbi:MAG TPA: tRNA 2-thiouridine(34) synthase MnmA [Flavobacteriales bacterium]|jgi:tRNA-specific 2-thiouridylase|nr:tRNA 2-thiouridine(34) synthase MnmA [Flavobacteriales bacterium]
MKKVVVGMSGGVDSSVAALLLKQKGYEVIGIFMRNWHDSEFTLSDECPWLEDSNDALEVAESLGIPFQVMDLSVPYKQRIVDYMFEEYKNGNTPNPDILCNREIKFDLFLDAAMDLGADFVATGHYCQVDSIQTNGKQTFRLISGADSQKDQSYFLCQLSQEQLSRVLFPIGGMEKSEVRQIARENGISTAEKKDSQGLCFIGKVRLPDFLQQELQAKAGDIIEIAEDHPVYGAYKSIKDADYKALAMPFIYNSKMGKTVGRHRGAHFFTIGQRKGLSVGGTPEPLFVIATDTKNNIVYTGQGENHPGLYRKALFIAKEDIHWVRPDLALLPGKKARYETRIRYRQNLEESILFMEKEGLYIQFIHPQRAIARGQFAAWYTGNELIGSGVIQ